MIPECRPNIPDGGRGNEHRDRDQRPFPVKEVPDADDCDINQQSNYELLGAQQPSDERGHFSRCRSADTAAPAYHATGHDDRIPEHGYLGIGCLVHF